MSHAAWRILPVAFAIVGIAQAQDKTKGFYPPVEFQVSLDHVGYGNHDVNGPLGTFKVGADARLSAGFRAAVEPFCIPVGRLQFNFGYKFGADVPTYHGYRAPFDLEDKGQMMVGALYLYPVTKAFEIGAGLDARWERMEATGAVGTPTKDKVTRGWLRGVARYNFAWGETKTVFLGVEAAMPLGMPEVNDRNYYQDYVTLTGQTVAGYLPRVQSPESLTRGHFASSQFSLVAGIRFGDFNKPCGKATVPPPPPPPPAPPVTKAEPTPAAPAVERKAEAETTTKPTPVAERKAEAETTTKATTVKEIEGLVVHFGLNKHDKAKKTLDVVKEWATANKGVVDAKELLVTGHTDKSGPRAYNEKLSLRRAKAVAEALRKEGVAVEEANIAGKAWDEPAVENTTDGNRAKNRRAEIGFKAGAPFKIVKVKETPVVVGRKKAKAAAATK